MMNFFRRSRRSKNERRHPLPPDQTGRQDTKPKTRSANIEPARLSGENSKITRDRPASTNQPNMAPLSKINEGKKTDLPKKQIPDVIASHESHVSTAVVEPQVHEKKEKAILDTTDASKDDNERRMRATSLTHSETDALGTLDQVLKNFDLDDNFEEITPKESKTASAEVSSDKIFKATYHDFIADESPYSTIAELKDKEPLPKQDDSIKNRNIVLPEPVYSKPIKSRKQTTQTNKDNKQSSVLSTDEAPAVPPKRFQENVIKFSDLRKTPSMSLKQSLDETDWADANIEKFSPKRRSNDNNNNNYSLKRGELSGAVASNRSSEYKEPAPDYDINGTLSSIGRSTNVSDESFSRDNWTGSLTSSSVSGSREVHKPIRPEVLELIRNRKKTHEQAVDKTLEGPRHDSLVKRSFKLVKKTSSKEELSSSFSEDDYRAIKNDADRWLANSERLRANSKRNKYPKVQSKHDSPEKTTQPDSGKNPHLETDLQKTPRPRSVPSPHTSQFTTKETEKLRNGFTANTSSDDEDLVRLMETGIFPENTKGMVDGSQSYGRPYVPRALRMNFGHSWDGIRRDRRSWKSREINASASQAARKNSKKLSNRIDDQDHELEMLF